MISTRWWGTQSVRMTGPWIVPSRFYKCCPKGLHTPSNKLKIFPLASLDSQLDVFEGFPYRYALLGPDWSYYSPSEPFFCSGGKLIESWAAQHSLIVRSFTEKWTYPWYGGGTCLRDFIACDARLTITDVPIYITYFPPYKTFWLIANCIPWRPHADITAPPVEYMIQTLLSRFL